MKKIIYIRKIRAGGIDGRNAGSKGGEVAAFVDEKEAEKAKCPWSEIHTEIHDLDEVFETLMAKLSPVQRLAVQERFKKRAL